jgi:GT2 family glycosyltransferase
MSDTCTVESQPTLSIVIVTWNGKKYALECLNSLRDPGMSLSTEIIVVDNGSTDGTPEAIHELFPTVKVIENGSNLGFAKANNVGVKLAKGKYICLINSDVVVPPCTLKNMFAYMEQNPTIGVLGPKMISPEGGVGRSVMWLPTVWNTLCCAFGLHVVFRNSRLLGGFEASGYSYDRTEDVEVLTGWFWMVRRTALEQVGPLDEQFFMYGEDIDWCYRFRQAGWRVVFYCDAQALHYGAASSGNQPVRFHIEMRRANLQCFRKHHGWLSCLGFVLATWLHELVRIGGYGTAFLFDRKHKEELVFKIEKSLACLGWLAGLKSSPAGR